MKIAYERKKFGPEALHTIRQVNVILDDYGQQGFDLTLRQLYYQFVAHDLFPDDRRWRWVEATRKWVRDPNGTKNAEPNYKWLGDIVNKARMGGYIDWDSIVDRTRKLEVLAHWATPAKLIESAAKQYRVDLWDDQPNYVEVWIEKDALTGVIAGACEEFDVPYFSCRGYTSQSEMWAAAQRLLKRVLDDKQVTILHLGDHDPSGIDMTRDIEDRLALFVALDYVRASAEREGVDPHTLSKTNVRATANEAMERLHIERIALNMDQVEQYNPPPNPAKMTDSRFRSYLDVHGDESWELDALGPRVLDRLVRDHIVQQIDDQQTWAESNARREEGKQLLTEAADRWSDILKHLRETT